MVGVGGGVGELGGISTEHSVEGCAARRHWKLTKSLLSELSGATADCCDAYAASELRRAGHRVAEARAWRARLCRMACSFSGVDL